MSMCSICVHLEACKFWIEHGKSLYTDFEYETGDCPHFTNRYDFEKVVRCEMCKFAEEDGIHQMTLKCTRFKTGMFTHRMLRENFCSYGERKEGE